MLYIMKYIIVINGIHISYYISIVIVYLHKYNIQEFVRTITIKTIVRNDHLGQSKVVNQARHTSRKALFTSYAPVCTYLHTHTCSLL